MAYQSLASCYKRSGSGINDGSDEHVHALSGQWGVSYNWNDEHFSKPSKRLLIENVTFWLIGRLNGVMLRPVLYAQKRVPSNLPIFMASFLRPCLNMELPKSDVWWTFIIDREALPDDDDDELSTLKFALFLSKLGMAMHDGGRPKWMKDSLLSSSTSTPSASRQVCMHERQFSLAI